MDKGYPIETAPKSTLVLVWDPREGSFLIAENQETGWVVVFDAYDMDYIYKDIDPTRWWPLPDPPEESIALENEKDCMSEKVMTL